MSDLKLEGQKDVLPELEPNPYTSISLNLGHALAQRNAQFLAHIRSTREEIERLTNLRNSDLAIYQSEVTGAHKRAELAESQHQQDEDKMKRAVEVLQQDNRCLSQKQVGAAIKILSPDTESNNKDITK